MAEQLNQFFESLASEMTVELPWPALEVPDYREARHGDWVLGKHSVPLLRGYFNGLQPMTRPNWVLLKAGQVWMSLTPMELESQAPHAAAAYGHTVIMGFGMGMLTYNVLQNPAVDKVTVIEIEPAVVKLIRKATSMDSWPGIEKLDIQYADALKWLPAEPVDVVLADIWSNIGDMQLRPDMQTIQKNTNAKVIAGWGMELDYISWMADNDYSPGDECKGTYRRYAKDIGLPLIETDRDIYPALATLAAKNVILY